MLVKHSDADLRTNDTSFNEVSSKRPPIDLLGQRTNETIPELRERFRNERLQTEQDRIREYNSLPNYGDIMPSDPEPDRYPINMHCTDEQFKLIQEAFDLLKKQSEGYIKRAENNPSESIKSTLTIERHQARLRQLADIQSRFSENAY